MALNPPSSLNERKESLIPLEIMRNTLAAGLASLDDQSKFDYKFSDEVVQHLAAVCQVIAHDLLETAAQSAHNNGKTSVSRDDVDATWPYVMLNF